MINASKLLNFGVKASVTLAVFWLVLRGVDFSQWRGMLQHQNLAWLAVAVALSGILIVWGAIRWKILLATIAADGQSGMTFAQILKIFYIGMFFSTCLPGTIGGDAIRVWLAKSERLPLTLAVHSVIIDRLIGLLLLCGLITVVLVPIGNMAGFNALPFLLVIIAGGAAGLVLLCTIDRIAAKWKHRKFIASLLYFIENLRLICRHPAASVIIVAFAFTGHLMYCMIAYAMAQSLGIPLSPLQCIILIPPVPLAAAMPVSIGGWGIREAGIVTMLALANVPQAAALMLSVQLGIVAIAVSLPGGILWLTHKRQAK